MGSQPRDIKSVISVWEDDTHAHLGPGQVRTAMMKALKKHPTRLNRIIPTTTGFQNHWLLISPPFPHEWAGKPGVFALLTALFWLLLT